VTNFLISIINPNIKNVIDSVYRVQKKVYGVYVPPTLKQVMTLKELLIKTGFRKEIGPGELIGLSKIECKLLIQELKKLAAKQEKNSTKRNNIIV